MKVKTSAVVLAVISAIVVLVGIVYYNYGLPILKFMDGERESDNFGVDIGPGDFLDRSAAPNATPGEISNMNSEYAPQLPGSNINILLLGTDDSASLTDTICVLSVNQEAKTIQIISIPRDAYVPYNSTVCQALKDAGVYHSAGMFKINASPYIGRNIVNYTGGNFKDKGINFLCSIIKNLLGYRIDEYAEVDFDGFSEVVDAFGGVEITIEEDMYDSRGNLVLSKGLHRLNGEMALFYARARHRYNANGQDIGSAGDPYRKNHQLTMLTEMAKQVVTVDNILRVKEIMESLQNAMYHSFDLNDFSGYAGIGMDYANGKYKVETVLIEGDEIDPLGDGVCYYKIYK